MSASTKIEWTDKTWNPIVGCSIVSPGCTHCYAMRMARRIERMAPIGEDPAVPQTHYFGTTKTINLNPVWTGKVAQAPDSILTAPLRWKKPVRIFVNSMGDLFHESVPDAWIDRVFAVMALAPQHTFQVLTKRSKRMRKYTTDAGAYSRILRAADPFRAWKPALGGIPISDPRHAAFWPQVHLGVSGEDQPRIDERVGDLVATPAAKRFVSIEPMLGDISFRWAKWDDWKPKLGVPSIEAQACEPPDPRGFRSKVDELDGLRMLDWIIVGGESGKGARPMHPDWARSIRDQCAAANVPFFFKQHGEWIGVPDLRRLDGGVGPGFGAFHHCDYDAEAEAVRVGKRRAGRLLDGVEHNGMPR